MAVDPIAFLPASRDIVLEPTLRGAAAGGGDFAAWLSQSVQHVSEQLAGADQGMQRLAAGQAQSLHEVMISLEQARLGVQLLAQVRNRLLDAYQEVLRMPV